MVGVGHTSDAWRQHIGHRLAVGILLDIDGTHLQQACLSTCRGHEVLFVLAPLTTNEVERTETEDNRSLEVGKEHAHITDAGEAIDRTNLIVELCQGNAILIPTYGEGVAIAQLGGVVTVVYDVRVIRLNAMVVGLELIIVDGNMILIVALILIEGVVLINILNIGPRFIRGVIALGLIIVSRRVTLGVVDTLVALEDTGLLSIEVGATEVMIVIASRILTPCLKE